MAVTVGNITARKVRFGKRSVPDGPVAYLDVTIGDVTLVGARLMEMREGLRLLGPRPERRQDKVSFSPALWDAVTAVAMLALEAARRNDASPDLQRVLETQRPVTGYSDPIMSLDADRREGYPHDG